LLKDHHSHPFLYAALSNCVDLSQVKTKAEALSVMEGASDDINVIIGWNDSLYSFDKAEIEHFPPTVIINASLHSCRMNASAVEQFKRSHGEVIRQDQNKEWGEKNISTVLNFFMELKPYKFDKLKTFYADLLSRGVWYAEEMSLKDDIEIDGFRKGELLNRTRFWADFDTFKKLSINSRRHVYGIKLFSDGALGAKTAKLGEPYLTGEEGVLIFSDTELHQQIEAAANLNKPVAIHAIGDRAIDQVVRILGEVKRNRGFIQETRLEHCQFISRRNAERAKSLGIILSMQPNFNLDSLCYRDRLSADYCARNNPFRMLIDEIGYTPGQDLIFGSDGMPHGAKSALEASLFPPLPGQALRLDEFIAGYCMPDTAQGYINLVIDEKEQSVQIDVITR